MKPNQKPSLQRSDSMIVYLECIRAMLLEDDEHAARRGELIRKVSDQIIDVYDPDVVETFLAWRENATLDTLMNLASKLNLDDIETVIAVTEDLLAGGRSEIPGDIAKDLMIRAAQSIVGREGELDQEEEAVVIAQATASILNDDEANEEPSGDVAI